MNEPLEHGRQAKHRCLAPAKINLYLHVTGHRPDGYHLLDSLVVFASVGDEIEAAPADRLTLSIDGPFADGLSTGPDNLVLKAAIGLKALLGWDKGAAIRLTKNLPVASGIGGGSADAAATLRMLIGLWGRTPDPAGLARLAGQLGADVPVCLVGTPSFIGGIGEDIAPAPALPPIHLVLVNPGVPVSTQSVFKSWQGAFSAPARWSEPVADAKALAALLSRRSNDLTDAAARVAPEIAEALADLAGRPGCLIARLSGSGATCFGLFADKSEAEAASIRVRARRPDWWVTTAAVLLSQNT